MPYAIILDNVVAELFTPPDGVPVTACFHPDILVVPTTGDVQPGWSYANGAFSAPAGPPTDELVQRVYDLAETTQAAGIHYTPTGGTTSYLFGTDQEAQIKLTSAFVMAGAGLWQDGTLWWCLDGSYAPLVAADVKAIAAKAAAYVAAVVAQEAKLVSAVKADPTTDITQGWPSNA